MATIDPLKRAPWAAPGLIRSQQPATPLSGADAERRAGLGARASRLLARAERWLELREYAFAEQALREALIAQPDHPELLRLQALALHQQRRYADAITLLQRARDLQPGDALIENNLGGALGESGDLDGALAAFRRASELAPDLAASWFNLGKAHDALLQTEAAQAAFARALELEPTHLPARVMHADALKTLGRLDAAREELRRAVQNAPASAEAWAGLASLAPRSLGDDDLAALEQLYGRAGLGERERTLVGFARTLVLEARGRYDEAFDTAVAVNALRRKRLQWDAAAVSRMIDGVADAFAPTDATGSDPTLGREVIFLVGMPRSGSTLTEQILAAHSDVQGSGEIDDLPAILREESARRGVDFPHWVGTATAEDWTRLGRDYLARTARWRRTRPRSTDKNLQNWQLLGAIRAMLPGAQVIDCRRDPLETGWSCFKHQFSRDLPFTHDFTELAAYWRDYDRLLRAWQARYPGWIWTQEYEALLAEPEARIRALLDHCGLAFEPACLRFHEAERDVRTSSAAQVRTPLQRDTARAHRYGALLDPLRALLVPDAARRPD